MNRCSFCNRHSGDVETLVAGAGVYIWNDCVELAAHAIANKPARPRSEVPVWGGVSDEDLLAHLPRIEAVRHQIDDELRGWVGEARKRGMSWDRIGRLSECGGSRRGNCSPNPSTMDTDIRYSAAPHGTQAV